MNRQTHIQAEYVEFIPERLEPGKLYISRLYSTAAHLCCCGCGLEVITPLNHAKWQLTESRGSVSLYPSIGNWSFPCQSHYWITGGRVQWASAMSSELIAAVQERDRQDVESSTMPVKKPLRAFHQLIIDIWVKVVGYLRQLLRL